MSANASNLSDPRYGYDLVCATTQDAINATMLQYLSSYSGQAFSACYVLSSDGKRQPTLTPIADLEAALGCDPFSIPNGADQDDPRVKALYDQRFLYAFKAQMGLPPALEPAQMPDVVILNKGSQQVSYQLYCADFQVLVLQLGFGGEYSVINLRQPATQPWTFLFQVNMGMRQGDQNAFNNLPADVQARIKNLNTGTMFSVQQLYLDLNAKGLQTMPHIEGLDPASPAFTTLTQVFINKYWDSLNASSIVLGYAVRPIDPGPSPSIIPTDLNIEVSPHYSSPGQASTNYGLYTLNYLVMSQNRPMPPAVPFSWNWVEEGEQALFHGVMGARRAVFADFLSNLISPYSAWLSVDTTMWMTHDGMTFYTRVSAPVSPTPARWTPTPAGTGPGPDGFTPLLTIGYQRRSSDDSLDSLHTDSIHGTFNYDLDGAASVRGNVIRMRVHAKAYLYVDLYSMGIRMAYFEGNVVDYQSVVDYTLYVDNTGALHATASDPANTDASQDIDVSTWDKMIGLGGLGDFLQARRTEISSNIRNTTSNLQAAILGMLNGSTGWIYPGGKTFAFKDIRFSDTQDLVVRITYADPAMLKAGPALAAVKAKRQPAQQPVAEELA